MRLHFIKIDAVMNVGESQTPQIHQEMQQRSKEDRGIISVMVHICPQGVDIVHLDLLHLNTNKCFTLQANDGLYSLKNIL